MARVNGPLFSEIAAGGLAKALVFRRKLGTNFVSKFYFPGSKTKRDPSTAQTSQRGMYTAGVAAWNALSQSEKEAYNAEAVGRGVSGYNLFMADYLTSAVGGLSFYGERFYGWMFYGKQI